MASNKTKTDFAKLQQDFMNTVHFFHTTNKLTLHCAHKQSFIVISSVITKYFIKMISVIDKSRLFYAITIISKKLSLITIATIMWFV